MKQCGMIYYGDLNSDKKEVVIDINKKGAAQKVNSA
jgi:hypothetical protein